jgi:hypothetical protein
MAVTAGPKVVENGLVLSLDVANRNSYPGSGTTINDLVGANNFTLQNPSYYSYDGTSMSFDIDRTNSPTAEAGGYIEKTGTTGGLTALNYFHNDHTTEIWFKADDRDPYDPTNAAPNFEGVSGLVLFNGFHSGLYFSASAYSYTIWGNDGSNNQVNTWSFNDTEEGVWTQLVAVRNGSTIKLYKNGVEKTSSTITAALLAANVSTPSANNIRIGTATGSAPSGFTWFSDITFSNLKMYKKGLTPEEVKQNFEALRGRFNI